MFLLPHPLDRWEVEAWGLWQYKSVQFNLIVYWIKHPADRGEYSKDDIAELEFLKEAIFQ